MMATVTDRCWPPKRRRLVEIGDDGNVRVSPGNSNGTRKSTTECSPTALLDSAGTVGHVQSMSSRAMMSSLEMEGEMVDQALDSVVSLPQAVNEVALMHKGQSTEIQRQEQYLQQLKDKIQEGNRRYDKTIQDIAQVTRRVYLTEDQVAEKKRLCENNELEVNSLLSEIGRLNVELKRVEEEVIQELEKFQNYRVRMDTHIKDTEEYERSFPTQKRLEEVSCQLDQLKLLKEGIEQNKEEATKITSGERSRELREEEQTLEHECQLMEDRIGQKKLNISEENNKISHIKQSIDVLHKRNAAQLTRLRRQLKEVQSHNRQWQEQAIQLQRSVTAIKKQLEE